MIHTKKHFLTFILSFLSLASLQPDTTSLQNTHKTIIQNLDMLFGLQDYYNGEAARQETLLGHYKHNLDSYFFKKRFSLESLQQRQSYITQAIEIFSIRLSHIDKTLNNPTYELTFNDYEDYNFFPHPTFLEKNSAHLYTLAALTLIAGAYTLYKPQTISHIKTASSSLVNIWRKGTDSLHILLGLKATDALGYKNLTEKLEHLTVDLDKNGEELRESLSKLGNINALALFINNPEDLMKTIQAIRDSKPGWLINRGVYDQLLKSLQNSEIISPASLAENRKIIQEFIDAMTKRTTNLSETVAVYQQIARNLLHLAYALIPISCSVLGGVGVWKTWHTIKHNKITTIKDHLTELLITTQDDGIMPDAHYGQLVYWTDKLQALKKSWMLSLKERMELTTLLSHLRNNAITPQQKVLLLSRCTLV